MWRFLTVCAAMVSVAMAQNALWENYKGRYGLSFEEREESRRMQIFENNTKFINKHNAEADMEMHTYTLGINQFAHMTHDEFLAHVIGDCLLDRNASKSTPDQAHEYESNTVEAPSSVDWRKKGAVTPIKNQGQCGSCYSFSTTGSLEGQWFRKNKVLVSLSEQQVVDCSTSYGNNGCNGGLMTNSFRYIKHSGGIETERAYPYEAKQKYCRFKTANIGAKVRGYSKVGASESSLKSAVASTGPISVAIDASHRSLQFYKGGIYYEPACSSSQLDHAVLAVGYGSNSNGDYWIVKNSWGTTWGLSGYFWLKRNFRNHCGIASMASYPLV